MRFEELSHMMQKPEPKPDTYEAGMAQNQLLKIGSHAVRLHNMIDDDQEMESWVAKKIDLASNYVKSVHGYTAGQKAGTYDDDGMSEARLQSNWTVSFQMPKGNHRRNSFTSQDDAKKFADAVKSKGGTVDSVKLITGKNADDLSTSVRSLEMKRMPKGTGTMQGVKEDAGEGHMSKSQLYQTAKMAIELLDMIRKGDDLEGWVQTKLNLAADYLQAVYHYEDYQKLNPYREDLDGALMQKHAGVIQKNLDEILARETKTADVDTKPGMMRILKKRVNEVEKEIAKENRKNTDEGGMPASVIKSKQRYANMSDEELADRFKGADEKTLRQMAWRHGYGNMSSHYLDRVKNVMTGKKTATTEAELEEGLKDWAKKTAAAGIIVAGLAGFNSINNAIDNSVPAIKAMNSALEMAIDQNDDKLAQLIKKDLSDAKLRLDIGKDLSYVKGLQDKYIKFMPTEGLAYESKLAVQLNQQLK
jgi:hypothetical protein